MSNSDLGPVQLVVNADDLGMTAEVNNATFDLMTEGLVTSATLIANGPYIEDACERIGNFPQCSFGVHLNITEFHPLSAPEKLQRILDYDGRFDRERIRQVAVDSILAEGIFAEFCAQIEKLGSLGVNVSHIDSHEHVHTIPRLFPLLKKVQKRFQIRRVRISRNIYCRHEKVSMILALKKAMYNSLLKHYYRTQTTQGFTDFPTFLDRGTSTGIKHQRVEVMVHPAHPTYVTEEDLLRGPWREELRFPVRLINYGDLC